MRAIALTRENPLRATRQQFVMLFVFLVAIATAGTVMAQPRTKKEKPKPRAVTLKTKDGVKLRAFYFPSDKEKKAIPVLLVHEWEGQASPYRDLVLALNKAGCAVLVPDYRGHGGSREYTDVRGETKAFNRAQMSRRDVENIIAYDLEKAKAFLKEENDAEMLNLNALVVIGVGEGCVMATHWALRDWKFPSVGRIKQGQDVKALVLISPQKQHKGVAIDPTLREEAIIRLPTMIVAGKGSRDADEAERLGRRLEAMKKRYGRGQAAGYSLMMANNSLEGAKLVIDSSDVIPAITEFIQENVEISDDENPWVKRD